MRKASPRQLVRRRRPRQTLPWHPSWATRVHASTLPAGLVPGAECSAGEWACCVCRLHLTAQHPSNTALVPQLGCLAWNVYWDLRLSEEVLGPWGGDEAIEGTVSGRRALTSGC